MGRSLKLTIIRIAIALLVEPQVSDFKLDETAILAGLDAVPTVRVGQVRLRMVGGSNLKLEKREYTGTACNQCIRYSKGAVRGSFAVHSFAETSSNALAAMKLTHPLTVQI